MKIDSTLSITAIIALSAIISPIITKVIDGYFQLKFKKIDLFYIEKNNNYKEYCSKASILVSNHCVYGRHYDEYLIAYDNAYLCANSSTRSQIDKVHKFINSHLGSGSLEKRDKDTFESLLNSLVKTMGHDLSSYRR